MAHPFVATMIDGGLEGCGPSQPWPAVNQHHFTAPTERTPSRESASNGPSVRGNDVRWRPGGLRSLAAVAGRKLNTGFTAPTERAPSRGSASNGPSVGGNDDRWRPGGLRSLAAVAGRKLNTGSTAPTERAPCRGSASNGPSVGGKMFGGGLEGCGPSQPLPAVN